MEYTMSVLDKDNLDNPDVSYFISAKQGLIEIHGQFAKKMGVPYTLPENYTKKKALHSWLKNQRTGIVLKLKNGTPIGILEYEIQNTEEDIGIKTVHISKVFLEVQFRGKGIFKQIVSDLQTQYPNMAISLSCWYDLPANGVYKAIGFKNISKTYILPPK